MNRRTIYFALAIIIQLLILAAVPARQIYAIKTGKRVILKTRSYDPYTVMSGYYVNLTYDISAPATPGVKWRENKFNDRVTRWPEKGGWYDFKEGTPVYVVLEPDANGIWNAKSCHKEWPQSLSPDAVVIKGRKQYSSIRYGIEQYYIPEAVRSTIQKELWDPNSNAHVEVKVDSSGHPALQKLIIKGRIYQY
jgi:uncharacterized membrane-anchored protein